jgi:hypothetical protein
VHLAKALLRLLSKRASSLESLASFSAELNALMAFSNCNNKAYGQQRILEKRVKKRLTHFS